VIRRFLLVLVSALVILPGCRADESSTAPAGDTGPLPTTTGDAAAAVANAVMVRVVDGDTIVVDIEGREERVRLIGIDTPESVAEERPDQCYGVEASDEAKRLLPPGTELVLERDVEPRDQYDRLLAYVYRAEDQLFINEVMVRDGFAGILSYPPNDSFAEHFRSLEATARQEGTGLWAACGGPDEPLE